ncbi:translation initiation factor IF-2-like [Neovison vison]|uniref:translation initiation factor IF-2-like n=1 Tax=Neovison vison TaxID=452646 RepID=UPI001CEFEA67|nr:translation initiation factor IF-2-like [Neogale vison]
MGKKRRSLLGLDHHLRPCSVQRRLEESGQEARPGERGESRRRCAGRASADAGELLGEQRARVPEEKPSRKAAPDCTQGGTQTAGTGLHPDTRREGTAAAGPSPQRPVRARTPRPRGSRLGRGQAAAARATRFPKGYTVAAARRAGVPGTAVRASLAVCTVGARQRGVEAERAAGGRGAHLPSADPRRLPHPTRARAEDVCVVTAVSPAAAGPRPQVGPLPARPRTCRPERFRGRAGRLPRGPPPRVRRLLRPTAAAREARGGRRQQFPALPSGPRAPALPAPAAPGAAPRCPASLPPLRGAAPARESLPFLAVPGPPAGQGHRPHPAPTRSPTPAPTPPPRPPRRPARHPRATYRSSAGGRTAPRPASAALCGPRPR